MPDKAGMAAAISQFLRAAGLDLADRELQQTPERVAQAWSEDFIDGYAMSAQEILSGGFPAPKQADLVVVTDLRFHSMCPHHLLPLSGRAHVAYLPGKTIVGFGQLSRLVDCFAHRLILQEALADEITEALMIRLGSRGAACVIDAEQACLRARGSAQRDSRTGSQSYKGKLRTDRDLRREFWAYLDAGA